MITSSGLTYLSMPRKLYSPHFVAKHAISSEAALERALDMSPGTIQSLLEIPEQERFSRRTRKKADGTERIVYCPHWKIRILMRRINKRFFANSSVIRWPHYLYGCVKREKKDKRQRDYIECAKQHIGAQSIVKLDISNFFSSISEDRVTQSFRNLLSFPQKLSKRLAKLNCLDGLLVQGSPCASYIAAGIFTRSEGYVARRLETKRYTYTRYVDDITISCKRREESYNFVIRLIDDMLQKRELERNQAKTHILRRGSTHMLVHGLSICNNKISLPEEEIKSIYSSLLSLKRLHRNKFLRESQNYRRMYNRCRGRIGKLQRLDCRRHMRCIEILSKLTPKSSQEDLAMCEKWTEKLVSQSDRKKNHYHHIRAINRTIHRTNLLRNDYPEEAKEIYEKLAKIRRGYNEISA